MFKVAPKTKVSVIITAGILITGIVGITQNHHTSAPQHPSRILHTSFESPIETLDSTNYTSPGARSVINSLVTGLYTPNAKGKPIRAMIEGSPVVSNHHHTYTFTLKKAYWSDSSNVTADDFVYAWQRLVDPKLNTNNAENADFIKNAAQIRRGILPVSQLGAKALDARHLQLTVDHPTPYLTEYLASTPLRPIKRSFAAPLGKKYGSSAKHFLSNGPFTIKNWSGKQDENWRLIRNTNYNVLKQPSLTAINFRVLDHKTALHLFKNHKLDFYKLYSSEAAKYRNYRIFHALLTNVSGLLYFNTEQGVMVNQNLRKAIALSFNKHLLTQGVLFDGSRPLNGLVGKGMSHLPGLPEYRQNAGEQMVYNPTAATAYWHKAQKDLGRKDITIRLSTLDTDIGRITALFLQSQLQHNLNGITVKIKTIPYQRYAQMESSRTFDILFSTWNPLSSNPAAMLQANYSMSYRNIARYRSVMFDDLIEKIAVSSTNLYTRRQYVIKAEQQLIEKDTALTGVMQLGYPYLVNASFRDLPVTKNGIINYAMMGV